MGSCCSMCFARKPKKKKITLIIIGLNCAGKTTIANRLLGNRVKSPLRTLGFSLLKLTHSRYEVLLYDLGGSSQIRDIWNDYYADTFGIIFVVDASDTSRFEECKLVFERVVSHEKVSGKPVLLLANKVDKENAVDELDLVDCLNIEPVVNRYQCRTRVETCSSLFGSANCKMDPGIKNGYKWLINEINDCYESLNERVTRDIAENAKIVENSKTEWKEKRRLEEEKQIFSVNGSCSNGQGFIENGNAISVKSLKNGKNCTMNIPNDKCINEENTDDKVNTSFTHSIENLFSAAVKSVEDTRDKVNRRKIKFLRRNKTAPLEPSPIPTISSNLREDLQQTISTNNFTEMGNSRNSSNSKKQSTVLRTGSCNNRKYKSNYLLLRPSTAPGRLRFAAKTDSVWGLTAPLEISSSPAIQIEHDVSGADGENVTHF